jgi:hypothetical protein
MDTANNFTYKTIQSGGTVRSVIQDLIGSYAKAPYALSEGVLSNGTPMGKVFQRPVVLEGNTYDLLKKYSNGQVYIDLEKVYVLQDNEVLAGAIPLINADTGLLSSPRRDDAAITVTTLFEPRIIIGQWLDLISTVNPQYNARYKVAGVQHQGIISEAVNGDCRTTISLLNPQKFSGSIINVS